MVADGPFAVGRADAGGDRAGRDQGRGQVADGLSVSARHQRALPESERPFAGAFAMKRPARSRAGGPPAGIVPGTMARPGLIAVVGRGGKPESVVMLPFFKVAPPE